MPGDGSAVTGVGEHHGFLHRPSIVAAHKADEAVVAVFAADRMSGVNGLGFDEKTFELGKNGARFRFVVAEFEEQVRSLGQARPIVVGPLALADDGLESAFVEARHFSALAETVLNCAAKRSGYLVFSGSSEVVFLFAQQLESAEQHAANEQDDRQSEARMWEMVLLRQ